MAKNTDIFSRIDSVVATPIEATGNTAISFFLAKATFVLLVASTLTPMLAGIFFPLYFMIVSEMTSALWLIWAIVIASLLSWTLKRVRLLDTFCKSNAVQSDVEALTGQNRVAVIGAGPVGLATVKELKAQGIDVVCFEEKDGLGGVYRLSEQAGGVWPGTTLTTSPWVTAFSDFPPKSDSSLHWGHAEYLTYLEDYASHFGLLDHLMFNQTVLKLERADQGWKILVRDNRASSSSVQHFDKVAVCSGLNLTPKPIDSDGLEQFNGRVCHVAEYKGNESYTGQQNLVVGFGESAVDIAAELADVSEKTFLSVKRGKFVVPRINPDNGFANDYDTNRVRYAAPLRVRNSLMSIQRKLCSIFKLNDQRSELRRVLLEESGAGAMSQAATKSDDFLDHLIMNRLKLVPPVKSFVSDGVILADGRYQRIDSVIYAHGYMPRWPFLEDVSEIFTRHPQDMYLNMFMPKFGDAIVFLGYARPALGSIPPTGELQARFYARLLIKAVSLPNEEEMETSILSSRKNNESTFVSQGSPNVLVEWIPYLDLLAGKIGCKPNPWKLIRSPFLFWKVMTGPMNGAIYRLHGDGAVPEIAESTVRALPRMHGLLELTVLTTLSIYCSLIASIVNRKLRPTNYFI